MSNDLGGKSIILANWKTYFSPQRAEQWCDEFTQVYEPDPERIVIITAPPFYLKEVAFRLADLSGVFIAAQTVSGYPQGAYTGSTPAAWLRGNASYTLLGHRERRKYFHESPMDVYRQAAESLAEELQPIICVDRDTMAAQTAVFTGEEMEQLIWAYTPSDAEQLERSHSSDSIEKTVKSLIQRTGGCPVLYGGGVGAENSAELLAIEGVSGLLAGRACLDAAQFAKLIRCR